MKLDTWTNSNMQNSMACLLFFVFDQKCPFQASLSQKIKIVSLSSNLVPKLMFKVRFGIDTNYNRKATNVKKSKNIMKIMIEGLSLIHVCGKLPFLVLQN